MCPPDCSIRRPHLKIKITEKEDATQKAARLFFTEIIAAQLVQPFLHQKIYFFFPSSCMVLLGNIKFIDFVLVGGLGMSQYRVCSIRGFPPCISLTSKLPNVRS